ncbi:MAG: hypothetical protein ACJASZ_000881, partial [Yoonia sp.]
HPSIRACTGRAAQRLKRAHYIIHNQQRRIMCHSAGAMCDQSSHSPFFQRLRYEIMTVS